MGSRNETTLMMERLLEGDAEKLVQTAVDMALDKDTVALRICMDRLMPPGKDRRVFFEFPEIRGPDDIPLGMMSIMAAITSGKIAPSEGDVLRRILLDYAKALTTQRRLLKLEQPQPSQEEDLTTVVT